MCGESATPQPALRSTGDGLVGDVDVRVPDERQREPFTHQPRPEIALIREADREPAVIDILAVSNAGDCARSKMLDQPIARLEPAAPRLAVIVEADLIGLRGVNALQPDPLVADRDGVGIEDRRRSGQCLSICWGAAGDGDSQYEGSHGRW